MTTPTPADTPSATQIPRIYGRLPPEVDGIPIVVLSGTRSAAVARKRAIAEMKAWGHEFEEPVRQCHVIPAALGCHCLACDLSWPPDALPDCPFADPEDGTPDAPLPSPLEGEGAPKGRKGGLGRAVLIFILRSAVGASRRIVDAILFNITHALLPVSRGAFWCVTVLICLALLIPIAGLALNLAAAIAGFLIGGAR